MAQQTVAVVIPDDRRARHEKVHKFWLSVADTAPALGMAGTIIGLIAMFAAMDDPASIGPAMALALLTTLYGLVIANIIAEELVRLADDLIRPRSVAGSRPGRAARRWSPQDLFQHILGGHQVGDAGGL